MRSPLMRIYAVIPTHNRHAELGDLLATIPHFVDVLVIDNASEPPVSDRIAAGRWARRDEGGPLVYRDEEQPPNLSRLWNIGLNWAEERQREVVKTRHDMTMDDSWAVAILNDDVLLSPGLLTTLVARLYTDDVDIAFPGPVGSKNFVNRELPFPGTELRMTGWCFVVRGSSGLRANENLRWWCGDDDLQAQAVTRGRGSVRVGLRDFEAAGLLHRHPDESTVGVLREQTEADMKAFVAEWGQHPWLPMTGAPQPPTTEAGEDLLADHVAGELGLTDDEQNTEIA